MTFAAFLSSMPGGELLLTFVAPTLLALGAFAATFVFLRRSRLMEDMPTSRLRSAAQGYVELEGTARLMDGPPIICPLTAERCIWWRYKVEEKRSDGRNRSWVTVDKGGSDDLFLLEDDSGRCIVDPTGADVIPTVTRRWYGYAPRPDVSYEQGKGFWRAMWCTYRYTEEVVYPGDPLYALGLFRTQTGQADPVDEQADLTELLAKWKHDPKMMALLDVNKDGIVDMREWEAARRMGLAQVRREEVARSVATPDLNVLGRPRDGRPYVLSGIPQARLVRRYRTYAFACLSVMTLSAGIVVCVLRQHGVLA